MIANAQWCKRRKGLIAAALLLGTASALPGQTQRTVAPGAGPVAKYSNLIWTVGKLDVSLAFYRDLIGLDLLSLHHGSAGDKIVGPYVAKVSGSPAGVVFSSAILRLPGAGFNLLMTEFGDVDRSRREANPRNPGASTFVLIVKDLDRPFHTLKREGARVVTRGGVPVDLPDHSRSVVVRDADGFLVQLLQPGHLPATELPESGNVLSAHVRLTVHRLDDAIAFYRGVLGFDLSSPSTRLSDPDTQKLIDVHGAQWRISTGGLPGTGQSFEFVEYENGGEASPFKQLRDPGTPAFSMSVRSVDALLTAVRASGAPVVSVGKEPVVSPNGGRNIFIRDADGFFLELEGPSGR